MRVNAPFRTGCKAAISARPDLKKSDSLPCQVSLLTCLHNNALLLSQEFACFPCPVTATLSYGV